MTRVRCARIPWGSTLVEAVVAIAVLTTGVISLCGLASVAVRTIALTRERTMAAVLASQKLESMVATTPSSLEPASGSASHAVADLVEYLDAVGGVVGTEPPVRDVVYVRRLTVSPLSADADLELVRVAVSPCRRVSTNVQECGDAGATVTLLTIRQAAAW